jgi:UDP-3-O-[3-hydroxymyristoyl] glucosamine N-acyltransferase
MGDSAEIGESTDIGQSAMDDSTEPEERRDEETN